MRNILKPFCTLIILFMFMFAHGIETSYAQTLLQTKLRAALKPQSKLQSKVQTKEKSKFPAADFSSLTDTGNAKVKDVIDPLTIELTDGRLINLTGLDFPDFDPYEPGPLSVTAIKILKDFLVGRDITLYQTKNSKKGRVNRMGHLIAHIERREDQAWVQGTMIYLGLARVRTTKSNPEMAQQMYNLEKIARREKAGLWAITAYQVIPPDMAKLLIGSFGIVEGKVVSVSLKKNTLYLNFGNNWRKDFTVSISGKNRRSFTRAHIDPRKWNGSIIRVRGWIGSFNGSLIEVDHPEAIEASITSEGKDKSKGKGKDDKISDTKQEDHGKSGKPKEKPTDKTTTKIYHMGDALP